MGSEGNSDFVGSGGVGRGHLVQEASAAVVAEIGGFGGGGNWVGVGRRF